MCIVTATVWCKGKKKYMNSKETKKYSYGKIGKKTNQIFTFNIIYILYLPTVGLFTSYPHYIDR